MKNASSEEISRRQAFARICLGSIFDFFNRIGPEPKYALAVGMSAFGSRGLRASTAAVDPSTDVHIDLSSRQLA
jgi:hypothetical protein